MLKANLAADFASKYGIKYF